MTPPARTHRASALARRDSLLRAAAELSAEVGAGAVTHRAVAARAGVPLSTTSYFFGSIDELVAEALKVGVACRASDLDAVEQAAVHAESGPPQSAIDAVVDQALANPLVPQGTQVELYLAAGRDPELRAEADRSVRQCVDRVARQYAEAGAPNPDDVGWAVTAFADGAMLHRLAEFDVDHRDRLARGLRLLSAAAMLRDDEVDGLLARYPSPGDTADPAPA